MTDKRNRNGEHFVMATSPLPESVSQLLADIRVAFDHQDWPLVASMADDIERNVRAEFIPLDVYQLQGRALLAMKDYAGAKEAWDVVCASEPYDVAALEASAHARIGLGEYEAALHPLTRALALTTSDAQRLALLRICSTVLASLTRQGRETTAQTQWRTLLLRASEGLRMVGEQDASWLAVKLAALEGLGRTDEAMSIAQALTARSDATATDWLARARLAWRIAQESPTDEVRAALDAASRLAPQDAPVSQARAELLAILPPDRFPQRLAELGFTAHRQGALTYITPPVCIVPGGSFPMGHATSNQPSFMTEVAEFAIARYPVTFAEYTCFALAQPGGSHHRWRYDERDLDHPLVNISWEGAVAYAAWLAERTGQPWRLPTEAEWEKAARWNPRTGEVSLYPWGNMFDANRCNNWRGGKPGTTPVGSYPGGASPCGALDMSGNVYEWTHSLYKPYPYSAGDGREDELSGAKRVLRGGAWNSHDEHSAATYRRKSHYQISHSGANTIGFRLVLGDPPW